LTAHHRAKDHAPHCALNCVLSFAQSTLAEYDCFCTENGTVNPYIALKYRLNGNLIVQWNKPHKTTDTGKRAKNSERFRDRLYVQEVRE
jgi:hypothetical protein